MGEYYNNQPLQLINRIDMERIRNKQCYKFTDNRAIDLSQTKAINSIHVGKINKTIQRGRGAGGGIFILKIIMPGSGDDYWRTRSEKNRGERLDDAKNINDPVIFLAKSSNKWIIDIPGPGGGSTKGFNIKGIVDNGSNQILSVAKTGLDKIFMLISDCMGQHQKGIKILIKAHSRNAVAATIVANGIKKKYDNIPIELVLFDPVPGPNHNFPKFDISSLSASTLIYSIATEHLLGFTPQEVLGAKHIIITSLPHETGIMQGFKYQDEIYKGSAINSLPEGVFMDYSLPDKDPEELVMVASLDNAFQRLDQLSKISQSSSNDLGRISIIKEVLTESWEQRKWCSDGVPEFILSPKPDSEMPIHRSLRRPNIKPISGNVSEVVNSSVKKKKVD